MSGALASQTDVGNVGVVLVESGMDYAHPDLQGAFSTTRFNATARTNAVGDPSECLGHGTAVAGVLGGVANNGRGIAGYSGYNVRSLGRECS